MRLSTRKLLDKSFTGLGAVSIVIMAASILIILVPIFWQGVQAYVFRGTVEHRELMLERFGRGDPHALERELARVREAREPVYGMIEAFRGDLKEMSFMERRGLESQLHVVEEAVAELLGPRPDVPTPVLVRDQYGATRWDRAQVALKELLYRAEWDYSDPTEMGVKVLVPRRKAFEGTSLAPLFTYVPDHLNAMLQPHWTFYWQFLIDKSLDAHFFGGVWPELLGTFYLTLGAILFAVPVGVIAAIYLCEYAREGPVLSLLRTCISTLAGVPSIVFGLFGLAFFINTMHVSTSKSVLAGSLTLALLILPTIIRAAEEAIRSVPLSYKEAALSLGAGKWHTVLTVVLPAALPGILTGIVISMGRAAGETAPIIFTAAVSVGQALGPMETLNQPTPALPWNIYNLATEHEAVDEIRHVQFGMVLTLLVLVLLLNLAAILLRARISRKLKA